MSGPGPARTISQGRVTDVGGLPVHRLLPQRGRRTVGAWCFLDRFGPVPVSPDRTMTVGPHPHIGLHTVTWLLSGQVLHADSLGNQQVIRPGQLNLMTAGHGIAHAEDARHQPGHQMDGVQLWVAQTSATRHGPSAFAHHDDLPVVNLPSGAATVLVGEFAGKMSPARVDSPLVGVDINGHGSVDVPLDPDFEHALVVLHGELRLEGAVAPPNLLVYLGGGRGGVQIDLAPDSRILLLGGQPMSEEIVMWWNFVARDRAELEQAYEDWGSGAERFSPVESTLGRIAAPQPFWLP
jgi:redox-sensitive bicupin YhaK (pirin superfamily)